MSQAVICRYTNRIIKLLDLCANLDQLDRNSLQMLWDNITDQYITLGSSSGNHKSTCFDLIRNNGILAGMEMIHTVNTDLVSTGTLDIGTHAV